MYEADMGGCLQSLVAGMDTKVKTAGGSWVTTINLDNAATTPPFLRVVEKIVEYAPWYSSIHRGQGHKSKFSSELYDEARCLIGAFVKADREKDVVIYTKNTTESINILSFLLLQEDRDGVVITTDMEHLANDLPWRTRFKVDYVGLEACGKLSVGDLEQKLKKYNGKVKLVTVTGASNVTGFVNPIHAIARMAHQYGAKILVDGAQLAPHQPIDMKPHDAAGHIDFLAFSGHKMYAPFGTGVLIGPKEAFAQAEPVYQGGGDVRLVSRRFIEWSPPPDRHEAGTPNIMGVAALAEAIRMLKHVGVEKIAEQEKRLIAYLISGLETLQGIRLYCHCDDRDERVSLISFDMDDVDNDVLACALANEAGIAVRSGLFCAHPYVEKLLGLSEENLQFFHNNREAAVPGLVRVSLGLYNTEAEIDVLIDTLCKIGKNRRYYMKKYENCVM